MQLQLKHPNNHIITVLWKFMIRIEIHSWAYVLPFLCISVFWLGWFFLGLHPSDKAKHYQQVKSQDTWTA